MSYIFVKFIVRFNNCSFQGNLWLCPMHSVLARPGHDKRSYSCSVVVTKTIQLRLDCRYFIHSNKIQSRPDTKIGWLLYTTNGTSRGRTESSVYL